MKNKIGDFDDSVTMYDIVFLMVAAIAAMLLIMFQLDKRDNRNHETRVDCVTSQEVFNAWQKEDTGVK